MSAERLFDTARISSKYYKIVSEYLLFLRHNEPEEDDGLSTDCDSDLDGESDNDSRIEVTPSPPPATGSGESVTIVWSP
jgi:hypothetical protein